MATKEAKYGKSAWPDAYSSNQDPRTWQNQLVKVI